MASAQANELKQLYQRWATTIAASPDISLEEWRDLIEQWEVVTAEPGQVDYVETNIEGIPALWATPKGLAQDRVLLSLHGGGFVTGSMYTHRKVFAHLAKAIGARALILNPQSHHLGAE